MLIRNGWVSNSSSSSFVVLYTDLKEFEFLKGIAGYKTFFEDMEQDVPPEVVAELTDKLSDDLHAFRRKLERTLNSWGLSEREDLDLFRFIYDNSLEVDIDPYLNLFEELYNKARSLTKDYPMSSEVSTQFDQWFFHDFMPSAYKLCEKLASDIINACSKAGKKFTVIEYGNDYYKDYWEHMLDEEGEEDPWEYVTGLYMEEEFMPWVKTMPTRRYAVIPVNKH